MPHGIEIELIDRIKPMVQDLVTARAATLADLRYAGVRLEVYGGRYATAENGAPKASGDDCALAFGIRVLAGSRMTAPGYFGRGLGAADLVPTSSRSSREGLLAAYRRAMANAEQKALVRAKFPGLGEALADTRLSPVPVRQEVVPAVYDTDPRRVPLDHMVRFTQDVSRARRRRRPVTSLQLCRRPDRALPRAVRLFGGRADRSVLRPDPGLVLCRGGRSRQ